MQWLMINAIPLLNIAGLICDIIGACLVAWEVVRQYKGNKFAPIDMHTISIDSTEQEFAKEHPIYKTYETSKYRKMKWGLFFLAIGFTLQIIANLVQFHNV